MTPEMEQDVELAHRLARIETTLQRICYELDLAINGIRHLLTAQGHRAMAENIGEQLELARQERREADTLPPEPQ